MVMFGICRASSWGHSVVGPGRRLGVRVLCSGDGCDNRSGEKREFRVCRIKCYCGDGVETNSGQSWGFGMCFVLQAMMTCVADEETQALSEEQYTLVMSLLTSMQPYYRPCVCVCARVCMGVYFYSAPACNIFIVVFGLTTTVLLFCLSAPARTCVRVCVRARVCRNRLPPQCLSACELHSLTSTPGVLLWFPISFTNPSQSVCLHFCACVSRLLLMGKDTRLLDPWVMEHL